MKKALAILFAFLLISSAALAEGQLEAPYMPDSAEAAVSAAAAQAMDMELHLTDGADTVRAADVMLQAPGTPVCADQSLLIASLQGYTSQDLRTAMQPVCRIAVSELFLVVHAQTAAGLGISDAESLLSYISEHEYEAYLARHIDADVIDRAAIRLSESLAVFTEGYLENEIVAALESGEVLVAVMNGKQIAEAGPDILPVCSLGGGRTEDFPDIPCAAELGLPVCEGNTIYLFASSDTEDETVQALATACLNMDPASVNGAAGYSFAPLSGEELKEKIRELIADYIGYMTSEGLFFYEE